MFNFGIYGERKCSITFQLSTNLLRINQPPGGIFNTSLIWPVDSEVNGDWGLYHAVWQQRSKCKQQKQYEFCWPHLPNSFNTHRKPWAQCLNEDVWNMRVLKNDLHLHFCLISNYVCNQTSELKEPYSVVSCGCDSCMNGNKRRHQNTSQGIGQCDQSIQKQ